GQREVQPPVARLGRPGGNRRAGNHDRPRRQAASRFEHRLGAGRAGPRADRRGGGHRRAGRLRGPLRVGPHQAQRRDGRRDHDARPGPAPAVAGADHGLRLLGRLPAPEPSPADRLPGHPLAARPSDRGGLPAPRLGRQRRLVQREAADAPAAARPPADPRRGRPDRRDQLPERSRPQLHGDLRLPRLPRPRPAQGRRPPADGRRRSPRADRPGRSQPHLPGPPLVHRRARLLPARNGLPARSDHGLPVGQGVAARVSRV
ncbi:MAG: hypothetical protein AVDCRST_MAG49-4045, partial [uncultured Thermomicrobiales bacterium]